MRISDWSSDVCSSDLLRGVMTHAGASYEISNPEALIAHRLGDGAFIHFAKPLRQLRLAEPRPPRDLRHGQWLPPAFADQLVRSGDAFGVDLAQRRLAMELDHPMLFERAEQPAQQFEAARGAEHARNLAFPLDRHERTAKLAQVGGEMDRKRT